MNGIPMEKQPITVTERTEAPFLLYAGDDEKVYFRVLIHTDIKSLRTISGNTDL